MKYVPVIIALVFILSAPAAIIKTRIRERRISLSLKMLAALAYAYLQTRWMALGYPSDLSLPLVMGFWGWESGVALIFLADLIQGIGRNADNS